MQRETERFNNVVPLFQDSSAGKGAFMVLTVAGANQNHYSVIGPDVCAEVQVSLSCLLVPEIGDTVLVYVGDTFATRFIVSVLARVGASCGKIQLPGNNVIIASENQMSLEATVLDLKAAQSVQVQTPELDMEAKDFQVKSQTVSVWSKALNVSVINVTSFVKDCFATVGQFYLRATSSFRFIDDFDDTHAGHQRIDVKGRYLMSSESVNLNASGFVRIDGSKIDLG